ncbi:hypothetical protein XM25_00685 [Devosia sp. H5989]|nr:hypothetical protein XM25_00685 [Devosia sp. H5989]
MTTPAEDLIARIKEIAPGYYTENDGGDWYALTPNHDRLAEDFHNREDARRCILWMAGDPMPEGWSILSANDLAADLDCGQGYRATIWVRSAKRAFPARAADLVQEG